MSTRIVPKLACPTCGARQSRVLDVREPLKGDGVWRLRACGICGERYATREVIDRTAKAKYTKRRAA